MACQFEPNSSFDGSEVFDKDEHLLEIDSVNYGCKHYRRRCKIRAPCCDEIFDCRHCHNETKNTLEIDPLHRHDVPRHEVKTVICSLCGTEQDIQQNCINCGTCMGKYFCQKCKFFDDDVSKKQYHCDGCGICRYNSKLPLVYCLSCISCSLKHTIRCKTGGKENFFHCNKCGCCYSNLIKDAHHCVERAMHHNCPVCFEFLFDTMKDITVLHCGHTIHLECVKEMELHYRYSCPVCSKSICDMSNVWRKLDEEVASTPMPETYNNKMVWILCNDCEATSEVHYHIVACKCLKCNSYNTRQIRGCPESSSCSPRIAEMVR